MKQTQLIMGMPITIAIDDANVSAHDMNAAFDYFRTIDERYSPYKPTSEVSRINKGLKENEWSTEMKHIVTLCRETTDETNGYFNAFYHETFDPSGLVKGWSIAQVADLLKKRYLSNFYIDAGGDIQVSRPHKHDKGWRVGIRNPMNREEIIKVLEITSEGVATSGTYVRGSHIYNPVTNAPTSTVASLTVVGPTVYDADRFATAAFGMGLSGIHFIESLDGFEGYMIDPSGLATFTSHFEKYVVAS